MVRQRVLIKMTEEFLGTHIGKKNGLEYQIKVSEQTEMNIDVDAYRGSQSIGYYSLLVWERAFGEFDLFLDLPRHEDTKKTCASFLYIDEEHREQGLSKQVCDGMVKILDNVKCTHVVAFTELGESRVKKFFIGKGYQKMELNGKPVPEDYVGKEWFAKEY